MVERIKPNTAGVDVGSETFFVAVRAGEVRQFPTFSHGVEELRDYLLSHGVKSVAMEATGVYWLPLFEVLERAGLEVCVVNGAHVRSLPGRKSDVEDCQWLAELHSLGLLRPGFIPPEHIRELRDYQRLRRDHIEMASAHVQHMQKAMERMNVKIHDVLSQTTGASAMRIIRAIVAGKHEPQELLELCDVQVLRTKRKRLREALRGRWQPQHLFALKQALQAYDLYQEQIAHCDREITRVLRQMEGHLPPAAPTENDRTPTKRKQPQHNAPDIADLNRLLTRLTGGQDLSQLPTMSDYSVLQLISEVGLDMTRWPTAKHFTAWLGLAPSSRQSGKRRRPERRYRGVAGRIFCLAARSLARSKYLALAAFYRRLSAKRGPRAAIVAAARKVAVLFYNALRYGIPYVEQGLEAYERAYQHQLRRRLQRSARNLGYALVPLTQPPTEVPG